MNQISLTPAEWNIMECLWEESPLTGREITEKMAAQEGWNRSTTLTLIRRLEAKKAIHCNADAKPSVFMPLIQRDDAALQETEAFLDRFYKGSVSFMVSALTKKQALSKQEIARLQDILNQLEGGSDD